MSIDTLYNSSSASASSSVAGSDRMNELTMTDFIKMMTAELTNQDPTNPMSNTEMLAQIGQIRSITSNDKLTTGIEALTLGQALSTASSLIGKNVTGMNSQNETVSGKVDKVTIEDGKAKLFVGSSIVNVENVTAIN
jgi:flagellar basal-body rod modification protein FlgD